MRKTYQIEDSVSGECLKVRVSSPVAAVIAYLKDQVVSSQTDEWCWDLTVTRLVRRRQSDASRSQTKP